MNIKSNASRLMRDDSALFSSISKLNRLELYIIGNLVLEPSWRSLIESMKSNCPKFHDEYWSLNVSKTVRLKSVMVVTPVAVTNPTGLNTSPTLKLYPLFSNTKLVTVNKVEPIPTEVLAAPTSIVISAPFPVSVVFPIPLLETPVTDKLEYDGDETWIWGLV